MSYKLGDIIQTEYRNGDDNSVYVLYRITGLKFEDGETVYVLRTADGNLERDIYSKLIGNSHIIHRKVMLDVPYRRGNYEG